MGSTTPPPLDLNNIQGDILLVNALHVVGQIADRLNRPGFSKKTQTNLFYQIDGSKVDSFRAHLAALLPLVTTSAQVLNDKKRIYDVKRSASDQNHLVKVSGVSIAFSHKGLVLVRLTFQYNFFNAISQFLS